MAFWVGWVGFQEPSSLFQAYQHQLLPPVIHELSTLLYVGDV